jgi:hypothetical protein
MSVKESKMIVNKPYTNKQYADLAVYCNNNNCHIEDKGDYLESVPNPEQLPPTYDEIKALRAEAYAMEVDCITAHIQRLRDENPVPEDEIAELIAERDAKVKEIQERYPYAEDIDN